MAPHPDPDDERPSSGPPLPPDDRLWRHPSELGQVNRSTAPPGPGATATISDPHRTSTFGVLTGVCLAGALVTLGVLFLSRPVSHELRQSAEVTLTSATSSSTVTSLTAPTAVAANPIHRAQLIPVSTTPLRPGRLGVEVTDHPSGALVMATESEGPAHRAGVEPGDVIVAVDAVDVTGAGSLVSALRSSRPGALVIVTVLRHDSESMLAVVLR